jgi:site-specific recombinase XerD
MEHMSPLTETDQGLLPRVIPPTKPTAGLAVSDTLKSAVEAAQRFAGMATADNTQRAYTADWADFSAWCAAQGLESLPARPETVGLYCAALAETHKPSTITRRLAAIAKQYRNSELESPASLRHSAVHDVIAGIRREKGTKPDQKRALATEELRRMITAIPEDLLGLRDRALLLIGFAGGFRRSEMAAIALNHVEDTPDGLKILIRRSKTDQEGAGRTIGIPYGSDPRTCPVRAYRTWIEAASISEGPVFRTFSSRKMGTEVITDRAVALVIKKAAERVGIYANVLSGHSLRSGHATTAARNGASESSIMRQTGHRSVQMVRRYIREGSIFHSNSGGKLG